MVKFLWAKILILFKKFSAGCQRQKFEAQISKLETNSNYQNLKFETNKRQGKIRKKRGWDLGWFFYLIKLERRVKIVDRRSR